MRLNLFYKLFIRLGYFMNMMGFVFNGLGHFGDGSLGSSEDITVVVILYKSMVTYSLTPLGSFSCLTFLASNWDTNKRATTARIKNFLISIQPNK